MSSTRALAAALCLSCAGALAKPLVYCADASPEGFDPSRWDSASTSKVTSQMSSGLVGFVHGSPTLKPELASAWQISPDAKTFTFARMTDARHPFHLAAPVTCVYAQSLGLAEAGDADDFLAPNLTCAASRDGIKFCNAEFDRLVEKGRATIDPDQRNALYRRAQAIFKRERPWITMAHSAIYIPVRRDVKGFVMAPNGSVDFEGVYRE
jgi:ABC-type transport system substrate-binding protein